MSYTFPGHLGSEAATILVPELDRESRPVEQAAIEGVETLLNETFGGFVVQPTLRGEWVASKGMVVSEKVRAYEVLFPRPATKTLITCARRIATLTRSAAIVVKIGFGKTFAVEAARTRQLPPESVIPTAIGHREVPGWPDSFDIGVLAVIGKELEAVQRCFGVDRVRDLRSVDASIYFRASAGAGRSIVVHCQGTAGNDAAAVATERIIALWKPRLMFLVGIAAGRRGKIRIGDVVTPRAVVDDTVGVARAGRRFKRPVIASPPYPMIQCLQGYRHDRSRWHQRLLRLMQPPQAPAGREEWYKANVATEPRADEAAIYSANLLLRDPSVLAGHAKETHEQIQVGEMEAAGFSYACQARAQPVPWFVVRAVSDFGDRNKSDEFFRWAAHSAATYLLDFIEDAIHPVIMAGRDSGS